MADFDEFQLRVDSGGLSSPINNQWRLNPDAPVTETVSALLLNDTLTLFDQRLLAMMWPQRAIQ